MTAVLSEELKGKLLAGHSAEAFRFAPEDVAAAVRFLASEEAGYITGTSAERQRRNVHVIKRCIKRCAPSEYRAPCSKAARPGRSGPASRSFFCDSAHKSTIAWLAYGASGSERHCPVR